MKGKKGIAVSQLVLLVLGILVLAVIAYLVYVNFISSSSAFDSEKCRARVLSVCTSCKVAGTEGYDKCAMPDKEPLDNWVNKCGGDPKQGGPCNFDPSITCQLKQRIDCSRLGVTK